MRDDVNVPLGAAGRHLDGLAAIVQRPFAF